MFIDYYSQHILKVNDVIIEPDELLNISRNGATHQIPIYYLNPKDSIMTRPSYLTEDIQISCYDPAYCRAAKRVSVKEILELSGQWQAMSDANRSRYGRYFDPIISIDNTWYQFNPVHSTSVPTGDSIKISIHENDQGKHFVKMETHDGFSYYDLSDAQFNQLKETLQH